MRFPQSPGSKPPFEVFATPVDYNSEMSRCQADLDHYMREECAKGIDPYSCGIDPDGHRHYDNLSDCGNRRVSEVGEEYCPVHEIDMRKRRLDELQWVPTLINHYLQNGIGSEGYEFFKNNGFIWTYEELSRDQYEAATDPLGKTINAFEYVKGWQINHLFWTFFSGVVVALGSVAIGTLISHNFETGLNAGSYVLGIEALILGGLTLFSVVVS